MSFSFSPESLVASGQVHPGWLPALEKCRQELAELESFITQEEQEGHHVLPPRNLTFRALKQSPHNIRVVIVGQDPYPTAGHAVGLAFSVSPQTQPLPGSLRNIFTELSHDMGCPIPTSGDLSTWVDQGVLLLNRVLSVREGHSGSHRNKGWEHVTQQLLEFAASLHGSKLVVMLWGKEAQAVKGYLGNAHVIESSHPSPLSAHRGFLGSRPFSRSNDVLQKNQIPPVSWCLVS